MIGRCSGELMNFKFSAAGARWLAAAALMLVFSLPAVAFAELKVVTTLADFGAMSRAILQDDGETTVLVRPSEDPHFVDPRPSFARYLNQADMVVYAGMELEIGWLPSLLTRSRNSAIQRGQPGHLDASEYVQAQDVPRGTIDRSMGDVHPGGNPHYNTDPRQMARVALAFGERLGQIRPAMADEFMERARDFARDNIRFAQKWEQKFAELSEESRQFISYHKTWSYVDNWLDLNHVAELEPKPGVPPNPRHIAHIIETMEAHQVGVILQLEYYPTDTAEAIANRIDHDVQIFSVQAMAREDQKYLEHLEEVIRPLYEAMLQISESPSD